eukprot:m.288835 g.288835  ORF g.288835 m.288835 type:complete len:174 (+) comp40707_c0_seq8:662-1183(+)
MSRILEGQIGVACMMDDVLVFAPTAEEHDRRLRAVLRQLQQAGLTLNSEKCQFKVSSVKFLGQIVGPDGVQSDPDKIAAIVKMPPPTDVKGVRRFLGMANQQAKYIPDLAHKTEPLRSLLEKEKSWTWGHTQLAAFEQIKRDLTSSPVLGLYDPARETLMSVQSHSLRFKVAQ